ncbi:MAG: type IV secretion system protein VirB10 [Snodgrassella alvi]|nr:type IV secretion system protein VirB10 [Snodgrassella alvi]
MANLFKNRKKPTDKDTELKPFDNDAKEEEENSLEELHQSSNAKNKGIAVIFFILIIFVFIGILARSVLKNQDSQQAQETAEVNGKENKSPDFKNLPDIEKDTELPDISASDTFTASDASGIDNQAIPIASAPDYSGQAQQETPPPSPRTLRLNAPLMAGGSGGGSSGQVTDNQTSNQTSEQPELSLENQSNGQLNNMLKPTVTVGTMAGSMGNLNLVLTKGTFIQCYLKTKLDTQVAGMVSCVIPRDIYSANGRVILIEKGSEVTGEFQKAAAMGMNRIFVLWTRITTPKGIFINIDSPATDTLGGSGLTGKVNNHWWKRFGNALLFSMIQDGMASGFERLSKNDKNGDNSNVVYSNSQNTSDEIVKEILKSTSNIPPTIYKNQGDAVGIYLARDLNFASVYKLRSR